MDVSVAGTIDQKTDLKKFKGASATLATPCELGFEHFQCISIS